MLSFIVLSVLVISVCYGAQVEQDLLGKILNKYDIRVRPGDSPKDVIPVKVDLYLLKMRNIDEAKGNVNIGLWVGMGWNDSRLTWKIADNKGTKKLVIPSKQIWVPDINLYTGDGVVEHHLGACEKYSATVQAWGEVYYLYPINMQLPCIHKTDKEGLVCTFSLESWTLPDDMLSLKTSKKVIDTSLLGTYIDQSYKVKSSSYEVKKVTYPDIPDEKYDFVKARITLSGSK